MKKLYKKFKSSLAFTIALFAIYMPATVTAEEISIIDSDSPTAEWSFDNGREFPGAKGGMVADDAVEAQYRPAIRLDADFTGGGNYVQVGRHLPPVDVDVLSFWIKTPGNTKILTIRLIDGTGQCHQLNLRTEPHDRWQRILFPVAEYFEKAGTSSAVEIVNRYEGWGGAGDGKWHNPIKSIYILSGRNITGESGKGSLWISNARIKTAAPKVVLTREVRLDEILNEGELDWNFNDGREFPGAKGGIDLVQNVDGSAANAVKLRGDFTGGGAYVSADHQLNGLNVKAIKMRVKTANVKNFNVRLGDGTGQCHQGHGFKLIPDNKWHEVVIETAGVVGGEHWGGANDGKWHGNGQYISLLIGGGSAEDKKPEMLITDIRAEVTVTARTAGEAYKESFDSSATLPDGWKKLGSAGTVSIISDAAYEGANAVRIERSEDQLNDNVALSGASFPAGSGPWSLSGATRSSLHSPDNSFAVRVNIEALDASGNVLESKTLVDQTGVERWKSFARQVEFPNGTVKARFSAAMHKTHGYCDIDALAAVPLEIKGKEKNIERIIISSDVTGNMFYPEDEVAFSLEVRSIHSLPADGRTAIVKVTDYWGAEQMPLGKITLERSGRSGRHFRYLGKVSLPKDIFEIGKYHELHIEIPSAAYEDAAEYSGFARLPVAESRQYHAEQIPFTIRNWDSRIPEYFKLASRIGLRQIGTWGDSGWERIRDLGDKWYGGPSGVSQVEREGWKNITEEQLHQNAINFMNKHKDNDSLACIMLGNEPNERPELVAEKIKAYKIAYEALKSVKPDILIVTTSVPALESFFSAGYYKYTDVYDFHVYETYGNVRQAIRNYRELGKKYGAEKPIWCTELGLNSQGQTRYAVACEMVKKFTAFFAEGGENVSWFTIMYPDGDGKARGTSGDAHNTFDCQYSQYNPRLDGVMYYTMINGITIKKVVDEVQHENGVQSYLFRDENGECFHVLWKEGERIDCGINLPGVDNAQLIRVDGSSAALVPGSGKVTLGLSGEPVLLRYKQKQPAKLVRELATPSIEIPQKQLTILKGEKCRFEVKASVAAAEDLTAIVPPRWKASFAKSGVSTFICTVEAPADTDARTGRVMVRRKDNAGEIIIPIAIMSPVSLDVFADARNDDGEPTIRIVMRNNGTEPASIDWTVELMDQFSINNGSFATHIPESAEAYLKGGSEGRIELAGGSVHEAKMAVVDFEDQTLYQIRARVTDAAGRQITNERLVGGFAEAIRIEGGITIDGKFDEPIWKQAREQKIDIAEANFRFDKSATWDGIDDLSAVWRAVWDDENLYLAVEVKDDVHHVQFSDGAVWNQDGLQFLFDPVRKDAEKAGKYDYSLGIGTKGPQAWCHLSGHSSISEGPAQFRIASTPLPGSAGGLRYEIAIPWTQLAPFEPVKGANLGMTMILNEDDGDGRVGFMGWFSGAHSKQLDNVGDLILVDKE